MCIVKVKTLRKAISSIVKTLQKADNKRGKAGVYLQYIKILQMNVKQRQLVYLAIPQQQGLG